MQQLGRDFWKNRKRNMSVLKMKQNVITNGLILKGKGESIFH